MREFGNPINDLPRAGIRAVLSDLDHTLTEDNGSLRGSTVLALERLHKQPLPVMLVSGCSAGWAHALLRLLPVNAIAFENGAGVFWRSDGKFHKHLFADPSADLKNRKVLQAAWEKIRLNVPEARLAQDQEFRLYDYAVDYAQEPPHLTTESTQKVCEILNSFPQIQWRQSSIHINYWVGDFSKRKACEWWLKKNHLDFKDCIYLGDSPNDEPLFEIFSNSVGVANIQPFLDRMSFRPRFIAASPYGAGFCEVVNHLLTP